MKITDIYYFSGTHWDREWYQNFQGFRSRLVEMTDELIEYLQNEPDFDTYHFDGQSIVLEDYLEIAPEKEAELKQLIQENKIKIGPWYNMPDEFLVSGESLIRNLMTGARICKKWGVDPWKFGYICDIFGHIAQMPQIFNGFDIPYALLGRGTTEEDPVYFNWEAPDGSKCITFRLTPENGYGNFTYSAVFPAIREDLSDEALKKLIQENIESEIAQTNTPVLILMDALDHEPIHKDTPRYLRLIQELYPDVRVHHCNLENAGKQLEQHTDIIPVLKGEHNRTSITQHGYLHLITNTLSSYYTHKQANDKCQNKLEKVIEPILAWCALGDKKFRRSYVRLAYKYLLQNHPHDSICGCSIDQVHKDMLYRFDQVNEIADDLQTRFLKSVRPEEGDSGNYILRLYNPLAIDRKECITVGILLKHDFPRRYCEPFGYEEIFSFRLFDKNGIEIPYERVKMTKNFLQNATETFSAENGELYTVSFMAEIPACGFSEYLIVPNEKPTRYLEKMTSGTDFAENELVRMEITADGEINLYDKQTGKTYQNLVRFADDGEIGDGWYHANPVNDSVVYSKGTGARIEKIESGPSRCVFRIRKEMELPAEMERQHTGFVRSSRYVKMPIVIEAGLSGGARYADVKITVDNNVKDHRLRLVLPTDIPEKTYFAGQAFYCNTRKTGIDYTTQSWREHDQYEKQMNGIVGKRDKNGDGIAFISANGLHECAGLDDGSLRVTLLRAFRTTVRTMGETRCQLQGELTYEFLLAPLDAEVTYSNLVTLQDCLAVKPLFTTTEVAKDYQPQSTSAMQLDGDGLHVSIIKTPEEEDENTVIVRVYNASDKDTAGSLSFEKAIASAQITNMNEEVRETIAHTEHSVAVSLTPWKVQTYKIIFE